MKAPERIPLATPDLNGCEAHYLDQCINDNWVSSSGPFVKEFESRLKELTGRRHAVATVNGTAALHLSLLAAGVSPGDKVVVPDWTFAATANAVCHTGAIPFFVDVTQSGWGLDPNVLADVLATKGHMITAIIAVHPLGHTADIDSLSIAAGDLPLIEDSAGAIGAQYKGKPAGAFGDFATFSFNGNKTITAGGGGMVVCDDETDAKYIRHISTQARTGDSYTHDEIGFNYRLTNLNAAVGLAQLERLNEMIRSKRQIARNYDFAIAKRSDLMPMPRPEWTDSACWLYSVLTATPEDGLSLIKSMAEKNIEAREFWSSLSMQSPYSKMPSRLTGVSKSLTGRVISLPSSSHLKEDEQARVIEVLNSWHGNDVQVTE